jgi:hypothetical protein
MGSTDHAKVLEVLASRALAAHSNVVLRPPILVPIYWMATGIVRHAYFPKSPDFIECGGWVMISSVLSSSSISFCLLEAVDDGALTQTGSREGCCAALNGGRLSGVRGIAHWLPEIELGNSIPSSASPRSVIWTLSKEREVTTLLEEGEGMMGGGVTMVAKYELLLPDLTAQ